MAFCNGNDGIVARVKAINCEQWRSLSGIKSIDILWKFSKYLMVFDVPQGFYDSGSYGAYFPLCFNSRVVTQRFYYNVLKYGFEVSWYLSY